MELEWVRKACPWDYLQIQNGSLYDSGVPYERICGRFIGNLTFFSFRESLMLLFVSDSIIALRGFKATYTQLDFVDITHLYSK